MDLGRWEPLGVDEVTALLAGCGADWWVAGGWAIDLHVGRQTRQHEDLDVLVLRDGLPAVHEHLSGWDLQAADPPGRLRPWRGTLPAHVHDVWCRRTPDDPWRFQLMVSDTAGGDWLFRRDPSIRRPVSTLDGPASRPGRRVLAPEVQLLHKSGSPRPKDVADLHAALPVLTGGQRDWLRTALARTSPEHPWLALMPR